MSIKNKKEKICIFCNSTYTKPSKSSYEVWLNRKYCSKLCYGMNNTGDKNSSKRPEIRRKIKESKEGILNPMYGKLGEMSPNWKGEEAGYYAKHSWMARLFGKPDTCEECGKTGLIGRNINWANISGSYKRERLDWSRLCLSCHRIFDKHWLKINRDKISGRFKKSID